VTIKTQIGTSPVTVASASKPSPIAKPAGLWQSAPTIFNRRAVFLEAFGDTGSGRTTFALTAPGPIAVIHCIEKIDGIIEPFAYKIGPNGDGTSGVHNFGGLFVGSPKEVCAAATLAWNNLEKAVIDAFTWARTIIIDTHTDAWELIRLSYFGALKPSEGRTENNYGPVNAQWLTLFRRYKMQSKCNMIVIGKTKDEYKVPPGGKAGGMGQRTGNTIVAGQKDIGSMAEVRIRTERDIDGGTFKSKIIKGWMNAPVEGVELENEISNFGQLMGLVTGTDPEEWER